MTSADVAKLRILIERGKFHEAEGIVRAGLAKDPGSAELHLNLAEVLFHLEKPKEAEAAARTAIGLEPDWGFPHELLAQILLDRSDLKGSAKAVANACSLDGDDADRRSILARIAMARGDLKDCLNQAEAGLGMAPDHEICRFYRGIAMSRLGRHDEADAEVLGLLRNDPEDSGNHTGRGWILLERNAIGEAKLHFQEALRLDSDNQGARSGLVRCLQQGNPFLGWFLRAIDAIERIPLSRLLVVALLAGIVLPRLLSGVDQPVGVRIAGTVLRAAAMSFFYLAVAAHPLFNSLLFFSRQGRDALDEHQARAVRWSVLPLLAGIAFLGLWISGGAKQVPAEAIGMLCFASFLSAALSTRQSWVRVRMLVAAGAVGAFATWFVVGPVWLIRPRIAELIALLGSVGDPADLEGIGGELKARIKDLFWVKNVAFSSPALAVYLFTVFADHVAAALVRRAPDPAA